MATTEFSVMTVNAGGAQHAQAQVAPAHIAAGLYQSMSAVVDSPDVIAVQESHQVWTNDSFQETSRELARIIGESYSSYFSPYIDSDYHTHQKKWGRPAFKGYSRVKQGNAIITNKKIAQWPWDVPPEGYPGHDTRAPITTQISRSTVYSRGNRDTEPRSLTVVPLSVGQISLYSMVTHLATLTGEDRHNPDVLQSQRASKVRLEQVEQILQVVYELRKAERRKEVTPLPIILAGDFNAKPGSAELDALEQIFLRPNPHWYGGSHSPVWTHTGHKIHVDHILYSDPAGLLTLLDCFVLLPGQMKKVTDHLPVIATFTVTADSKKI